MGNPFENIFGGGRESEGTPRREPQEYTGEMKLTEDETGAVISEETAAADREFGEEKR